MYCVKDREESGMNQEIRAEQLNDGDANTHWDEERCGGGEVCRVEAKWNQVFCVKQVLLNEDKQWEQVLEINTWGHQHVKGI